ncbi:hypothetical protein AB0K40_00925 [Nonomuraea bangladeshensis]|uniref:Uncharacterized protein n=1 Tax=Nonomuraea bangladeshensis TaxID=404385 RepID=A0ABV3GUW2_9ACTN
MSSFVAAYKASDFPPGIVPYGNVYFSSGDLAHALFTTGRAPGDTARHGLASVWEWLHRVSLIPAYLRSRPANNRVVRSSLANALDRSEKVAVSYAIGQAMTQIFSEHILQIPFLMHIDRYATRYGIAFTGKKRPDLFGLHPPGDWVVAESKGRSGSMESDLRQKLIDQKRSVRSIKGVPPSLAYGCVASFPRNQWGTGSLRLDLFDPVEDEVGAVDIPADIDSFILAYYEPFMAAISAGDSGADLDSTNAYFANFTQFRMRFGVIRPVYERIHRAQNGEISGLFGEIAQILQNRFEYSEYTFLDGSIVETDWSDSFALSDWEY